MCFREITNIEKFPIVGTQVGLEPGSHLTEIRADGVELLQAAVQGFTEIVRSSRAGEFTWKCCCVYPEVEKVALPLRHLSNDWV